MGRTTAITAMVLGACAALPAEARDRQYVLEPTSDWVLDYAAERCTLVRRFGAGDEEVRLRIDSFGSWTGFRFLVAGEPVPNSRRPSGTTWVRFTPDTAERQLRSLHGESDDVPAVGFLHAFVPMAVKGVAPEEEPAANVDQYLALPSLVAFERDTRTVALRFQNQDRIELKVGSMAAPLKALRTCVDDLHRSWGLEPATSRTLTRSAVPSAQTVSQVQRNYPFSMSVRGTSAYVPVRVIVDPAGTATSCVVQNEAANEEFKRAVCQGLAGGYAPALDAAGQPVTSVYQTSVIYMMGG